MKLSTSSLLTLLSLACCTRASTQSLSDRFDKNAKEFFVENIQSFDLSPLPKWEQCVLEQTVINDLTLLNNWRTVFFYDSLIIKTYHDSFLQLPFAFIQNKRSKTFYFLWVPFLKDYVYNVDSNYQPKNDTIYVLKEPVEAIKLSSHQLDDFFAKEVFAAVDEQSFFSSVRAAKNLIKEVLPTIYANEISVEAFKARIDQMRTKNEMTKTNYDFIMEKLINPMFDGMDDSFHRVQTFHMAEAGYVILLYLQQSQQLKLDIYFVPEKERPWNARGTTTNYKDCFR
jgi:hypothetical protein